jgi:hypothetical protein
MSDRMPAFGIRKDVGYIASSILRDRTKPPVLRRQMHIALGSQAASEIASSVLCAFLSCPRTVPSRPAIS